MSIIPTDIRIIRLPQIGRVDAEQRARREFERSVKRWIAGR